jgi:hypothetical protein
LLERIVGEPAKVKWSAGQLHRNLRAADDGVTYKDTYCAFAVPEAETLPLDDAIIALSRRLEAQAPDLPTLISRDVEVEIYATLEQSRRGKVFRPEAISALGRMNAGLAIDWVAGPTTTDESADA